MQIQKSQESSSPQKRANQKTKGVRNISNQQKNTLMNYKLYLRQFPFGIPEKIIKILQNFQSSHNSFLANLENLKLYKIQLALQFQTNWIDVMDVLKNIINKYNKKIDQLIQQKRTQITKLLELNVQRQKQIQNLKDKLSHVERIRQIQKGQLDVANAQVESVNKQISNIYDILKSDMGKILKYLAQVQTSKQKQSKENSDKIYQSLQKFKEIFNKIENQHKETGNTLLTMKQTIKFMERNTQTTTGTQVDECQLLIKAQTILNSNDIKIQQYDYDTLNAATVNNLTKGKYHHVIDKLKMKQKQLGAESYHPKASTEKSWALTPTLLTFLQGISKQNEVGRVMPWQYMKNLINEICQQRIKREQQLISGMVGNSMLFDQFVVCYFIKKHRIRRLAEVKLLQFLISLKYYSKLWIKAQLFCVMMDIMRYIPIFDHFDSFNYRIDYYSQNYFFQMYRVMSNLQLLDQQDGSIYIPFQQAKKIMKIYCSTSDDKNKSRVLGKLDKSLKIFQQIEYIDFDYCLMLCMEDFFLARRKITEQIAKTFAKYNQKIQGFYSVDEIIAIFNQLSKIYNNTNEQLLQKYPVQGEFHIMKLYLYSITNGKNNYQITNSNFLDACQRYGFNSPFPFLHSCHKYREKKENGKFQGVEVIKQSEIINESFSQREHLDKTKNELKIQQQIQNIKLDDFLPLQKIPSKNLNQQRINIASRIFSQHFSLLKQLKDYVTIFGNTLSNEKNSQILWKSFNQIKLVLEKGCAFMKYPLICKS